MDNQEIGVTEFQYKTAENVFYVNSLIGYISIKEIAVNYNRNSFLCERGCKNFTRKYSCPPFSSSFDLLIAGKQYLVVNVIKVNTRQQIHIYNTIRMANVVAKSIQKKAFNFIDEKCQNKEPILENGSCRLCKKCNLVSKLPCRHPEKMRPSLEATGIDVNDLVIKIFGFELQWYRKSKFPDYQCTVCGIITNNPDSIIKELSDYFVNTFTKSKKELQPSHQEKELCFL